MPAEPPKEPKEPKGFMQEIGSAAAFCPDTAMAAPENTARRPVLLVHGLKDDARKMEPMARYLRSQGWAVCTLSLRPSWGQLGLEALAQQVAAEADRRFAPGQKFDLVAFSMGGLVSRYYLQRLGGLDRVGRFITLSTPHHGTWLAYLIPNAGCRQMRPGSAFLKDLASDEARLKQVRFTSFWTPFDLIIIPSRSSEVNGARNLKKWIALHPLMVWQTRCLQALAAELRE